MKLLKISFAVLLFSLVCGIHTELTAQGQGHPRVGGQPNSSWTFTEQEMSNINPSVWGQTFKDGVNRQLQVVLYRIATGLPTPSDPIRVGNTIVNALTPEQKSKMMADDYLRGAPTGGGTVGGTRPAGPGQAPRVDNRIPCSELKYSNFWSVLGLCKN
jgi:hypothetical protein